MPDGPEAAGLNPGLVAVPAIARERVLAGEVRVVVSRRRVVRFVAALIAILVFLSFAGQVIKFELGYPSVFGLVPLLDVNLENNIPTWYQSIALATCAGLLALLGVAARRTGAPFAWHWLGLALIFLLLSLDEVGSLHERTVEPLSRLVGRPSGVWAPTWTILGAAAVVAIGASYLRFVLHLAWRERICVVAAGVLFVGGALGMEMVAALFYTGPVYGESLGVAVFAHLEELLEKLGVLVFLDFLLRRAADTTSFRLTVGD
jgi:hypothetical protein